MIFYTYQKVRATTFKAKFHLYLIWFKINISFTLAANICRIPVEFLILVNVLSFRNTILDMFYNHHLHYAPPNGGFQLHKPIPGGFIIHRRPCVWLSTRALIMCMTIGRAINAYLCLNLHKFANIIITI